MKRYLIKYLILFYFVFFIPNILAQNKITPLKIKWKHDFWFDLFSTNIFNGDISGYKLNFIKLRYKNFKFGFYTAFSHKLDLGVVAPNEDKTYFNSLIYILPIGYYIPIYNGNRYSLGMSFDCYLLPVMFFSDEDEERIEQKRLPKLFDFSLRFDHNFFSISTGFRKQNGNWELKFINEDPIIYSKFNGFYIEFGIGLTGGENESIKILKINHEQRNNIENQVKKVLPDQNGISIDSYEGYLEITTNLDEDKLPFDTNSRMNYTNRDLIRIRCKIKCAKILKAVLRVKDLPPLLGIAIKINHGITRKYYEKFGNFTSPLPYKSEEVSLTLYVLHSTTLFTLSNG